MLKKDYIHIMTQIDYAIKKAWIDDVAMDYGKGYLLKEDTLKNSLYFHIRKRLDNLADMYNIRIYTEYNETTLKANNMRADIAIVELDTHSGESYLGNRVKSVLAIIELKYGTGTEYMSQDIEKIKRYKKIKELEGCQYYLGFLNEQNYFERAFWLNGKQTNNWAKDCVTELDACRYNHHREDEIAFSICSYNPFNSLLNTMEIEDMNFIKLL